MQKALHQPCPHGFVSLTGVRRCLSRIKCAALRGDGSDQRTRHTPPFPARHNA
ncbi:hypothetical protein HPF_08830 [Hydrogenophaga pseudoflava]|jgi:hypothetical protein|uniref:Uncharacterized protein n=1 Tax=Hydrogenophaga pseudoflava TaxID=47421 RepID=A0A4P6WZZ3_HYDPS|nr:hypothetical protein HPF_08830 [Hydrogenophaga pseudoflava]